MSEDQIGKPTKFVQHLLRTMDKSTFQGHLCHEILKSDSTQSMGEEALAPTLRRLIPIATRWECKTPADLENFNWHKVFERFNDLLGRFVEECDALSDENLLWILPTVEKDDDDSKEERDKKAKQRASIRKKFKLDRWIESVDHVTLILDFSAIVLKHGVNRHKYMSVPVLARLLGSTIDFVVDSTLSVVNSLVRPIELHRELEEQNVTDTPASYSRDIQMQLFRLVHGWSETNDVDITQIASVKQSKIPVALSGLHFEYFVSNTSSSDVKSSDTSSLMTTTSTSTTTTTTTKKSKKKKRNSKVVRTPPPPSRKKRKVGGSLSSTGLRVLKVSSKQMGKIQCTRNDPGRTGKWFAKFVRVTFERGNISLSFLQSINHIRTQVRENKIPKKQWPPLLAIARRCTSFASKQGRIRALNRRFNALRALLRSNPQDALIDLYFAHEPELVPQMAKACSPDVSMPSSVQLSILNALEALVVWCDTGGGHFTMLAKRTWCSSAKRENITFLFTYSEDSLVPRTQPMSLTRVTLLCPSLATIPLERYGNT